jgi:hypothetical protein
MKNIEEARVYLRNFENGWCDIVNSRFNTTTETQRRKREIMIKLQNYIESHERGNKVYEPRLEFEDDNDGSGPSLTCNQS